MHPDIFTNHQNMSAPYSKDTVIGNDVWIGHGAIILSGKTIGNGAVIGTGAVEADIKTLAPTGDP